MDSEKLIALVFDRRLLWDQKSKGYHNRDKSRKLWEEVAAAINNGVSSEMAKSKWKGLRDTFRKEYYKTLKSKSGEAGGETRGSSWPYYESLFFLADQMTPKETCGNVPLSIKKNSCNTNLVELVINDEYHDEPDSPETQNYNVVHTNDVLQVLPSTSTADQPKRFLEERNTVPQTQQELSAPAKAKSSRPAKRVHDVQSRMLALEEEKLKIFKDRKVAKETAEDYDHHFLMSLLPHFKNIKPERKLHVQLELQQVLFKEINSTQTSQHAIFGNGFSTMPTIPQSTPSSALTQSSYISPFSPPSVSQHFSESTSSNPVHESTSSEMEDQEHLSHGVTYFVSNFEP